jgi:hypothetical protein
VGCLARGTRNASILAVQLPAHAAQVSVRAQVLREVAVFDTINPGGFYAARVKPLGAYAAAAPGASHAAPGGLPPRGDIADPLYGNSGGAGEAARLRAAVAHLRAACAGLLSHLRQLHARRALCACLPPHPPPCQRPLPALLRLCSHLSCPANRCNCQSVREVSVALRAPF